MQFLYFLLLIAACDSQNGDGPLLDDTDKKGESSDDSGDTAEPLVDPVVLYVDASHADDLVHNGTADHP
ncbi:MAG: hypothetical protein HN348_10705, partial [Proteobacteria bacterium]|nr:hypothetical protein [Pseudomonadota bacterium]